MDESITKETWVETEDWQEALRSLEEMKSGLSNADEVPQDLVVVCISPTSEKKGKDTVLVGGLLYCSLLSGIFLYINMILLMGR